MSLIGQATKATRTIKNVGRMREIVGTLSRFGFGAAVEQIGLHRFLPEGRSRRSDGEAIPRAELPVRLRQVIETLGPAFIKVGQVMAGRPDLIPQAFIEEFGKLQDHVSPVPFSVLKPILMEELKAPLEECFSSFDTEPLATASIAQVHAARTRDGNEVVVKILKPDVPRILSQDLEILEVIAGLAEKAIPELRPFRLKYLAEEFRKTLLNELNFALEANHIRRFRNNFSGNSFLVVPKVYGDLSTSKVLTLERLRGVKLSDVEGVRALGVEPKDVLREGMKIFYQSIMVDGFFHADPHAGNIFVLPDGRMGLIDFGSVGHLSLKAKDAVVNMFLSILNEDYEALIFEYLHLSPSGDTPRNSRRIEALQREVGQLFSPYMGVPLKSIPIGKLLLDATGVAIRNDVPIPRDLVLLFRSIMTLEGIGRMLDPDFDLVEAAGSYAGVVLRERYSPKRMLADALSLGREAGRFAQSTPRQLSEVLRQLENGDFKVIVDTSRASQLQSDAVRRAGSTIALALFTSTSLIMSVLSSTLLPNFPIASQTALWTATGLLSAWLLRRMF